ncbi:hypothetical protein SOX05_14990 [Pseudomonas putida]|nr:hypothetical protein [Pseudomonas putida]MDY4320773.1 hypothetical protein [Pseudomonas putida]MDY4354128.1 hypothetical protein [Pseudomonas putida]
MKRNINLAKRILEVVVECQDPAGITRGHLASTILGVKNPGQAIQDDRFMELNHQIDLLTGAGFLLWRETKPGASEFEALNDPLLCHVTWAGHDLLESL